MLVALTSEATAAILGALAGGLIALCGQALFVLVGSRNARRTAAAMIFAELVGNLANAKTAIEFRTWTSTQPAAHRAAWESYGGRLLLLRLWHQPHDLGHIASAYNRIDDIAWLATNGLIDPHDDFSTEILDVQAGLYVVGKIAGYSGDELRTRGIPVDDVRKRITSDEEGATPPQRPLDGGLR